MCGKERGNVAIVMLNITNYGRKKQVKKTGRRRREAWLDIA
jgi:hypothetical protein